MLTDVDKQDVVPKSRLFFLQLQAALDSQLEMNMDFK